ncbi:MurR/RpiR family transcriptional regulator [Alteromonas sediminis]|uniref:MurR/RpiR family transcriptional regulator n=1 Tax=Alteromonas sediminis TaxID=2259342 RepID=A0A3N5Y9N2_9ALTE|nr:MurR/RpiR family transcriptional regulator [Alteromonas sediminis]RPJ68019.1 MurR/RpiR family transcriptional regulator [Alteromonas sediminis]
MSYEIDVVSKISEIYNHLSDAEQKVATVILDDLVFAANASITEIASKAEVSEATITRFAKSVNCKNVRSLKLKLAQSVAVGQRFISESKVEPSGIFGIYESIKKNLDDNAKLMSEDLINTIVDRFQEARQVFAYGVGGGSTIMAQETQYRLFRLGFSVTAYSDPVLMRMASSTVNQNDVIFCLSLSGCSPDVCEAAQIAQQYGATIVSITQKGSPLAQNSDFLIPIETEETDYIFSPSTSRYAMLAAIDVLVTELAVKRKRTSREKLRRIKLTLDHHFHGNDRLPLGD